MADDRSMDARGGEGTWSAVGAPPAAPGLAAVASQGTKPRQARQRPPFDAEPLLLDEERNRRIVDGARALGILLVVFFHVLFGLTRLLPSEGMEAFVVEFPRVLNIGWQALGSEVIFFLSGFLLSYLLLRELSRVDSIDVRDYLVRRVSRILPLYAIALALFSLATDFTGAELVLNLLFVSKIFGAETIIPVGWSLELLMQVYLLLPFLVLAVVRSGRPVAVLTALIVASLGARYWALAVDPSSYETPFHALLHGGDASDTQQDLYYLIWFRATPFLAAVLVAYWTVYRPGRLRALFARRSVRAVAPLLGMGLLVASGCLPLHDRDSVLYDVTGPTFWLWFWTLQRPVFVTGLALVLLSCWFTTRGPVGLAGRFLAWQPWGFVSRNIYSIYLFHLAWLIPAAALALWTVDRDAVVRVHPLQAVAIFALGATFSLLFAAVLTRFVEAPSQRWIRRRYLRRREG